MSDGRTLTIPTRLFGPLTVSSEVCIAFPDGLLGFAGERRFVLLPAAQEGLYWLQSAEESGLAFLLVDPFPAFPGYVVDLGDGAPAGGDPDATPPLVLAIVTLPRAAGGRPTANLQGPVVIDLVARRGRQTVLPASGHGTQEPLELEALANAG